MSRIIDPDLRSRILDAYRTLFPASVDCTTEEILNLDLRSLRNAFRRRALATHPDRARHLGQDRETLTERFREISDSFDRLHSFIEQHAQEQGKNAKGEIIRGARRHTRGSLPEQEMVLGQYLYHMGRISYRTLLEAVYWQRNGRPRYGSLAFSWKILSARDIQHVMKERRPRERFGECAIRLGLMDRHQHMAILKNQQCSQKPIGEFFVSQGIVSAAELEIILYRLNLHNQMVRRKRSGL